MYILKDEIIFIYRNKKDGLKQAVHNPDLIERISPIYRALTHLGLSNGEQTN